MKYAFYSAFRRGPASQVVIKERAFCIPNITMLRGTLQKMHSWKKKKRKLGSSDGFDN